ncbi:MAG: hypothetical protein R2825_16970 [Saprospiraceae bacterium]
MAKLSLTLYFVFFLSLDSFSQINKAIPFTKDSLYGSWMFQIMSYRKHTNRKRVYYYQNVSVYHFDQDSFKRIFYMPLSDSIKVDFGTYTLNSDTLILKRLFKDQKFYESFFRIETLNYDTIDIIGKYDHSDHARLTRLRPGLPIDTLHAYKILTGNICMIEYDEQENDKIENFKKIEYRTPPLQSLIFMHTNYYLFSKSEETRFGETNPRIIVDRPSNKAFLWFSDFQKPVLINQIIGDTIFGHEVDEKFKTLRIYPIDSIGMPRNYQGVWEISNSNSMKNIKGIKIKSDTVLFFLTNNKILETKLIETNRQIIPIRKFNNSLIRTLHNYLFLKGSSSIENDKNKTLYTTAFFKQTTFR